VERDTTTAERVTRATERATEKELETSSMETKVETIAVGKISFLQ
jgi:hypothetical protein